MAFGFDASSWDTPQVALFEALGEVVDTLGPKNAGYLAHRISSPSPSREFLERMRRLESDSKLAQEVRMLLGESVQRFSLSRAASETEAYQMRIRHLMVKEQILDTLSTDGGFANQFLVGVETQYEGTDLHALAKTMLGMRGEVIMLGRALGVEGEKMAPEEIKNKVAEWRAKAWDWDNYVTAAGKESSDAREVERGRDAERQVDRDATYHTAEKPSAALIPISNPASPKLPSSQSDIKVKEDRNKQQAKLKKAIDANRLLQAKLRQVSDNRNRWSEYCEHLQKKLERSNALLKEHQVAKELGKTAEPEEGGPLRPQNVEREEAVIDVVTPEPEHSEVPPAALPVSKEAMGPAGRAKRGSSTRQTVERDAVHDGVRPEALREGVSPAPTPKEFHGLYQPKPNTTYKSRPHISILSPNARVGRARLARALPGDSENANPDSDVETMEQDMDMVELYLNSPAPGTAPPAMINQSAILTEPASAAPSPKLPKLLHTTTVPDSLAESNSVSHHTSSTQAEHPTSGADTINAEEANQANGTAAPPPPSDDEPPVVVSERNVRKRKHNGSPPNKKIKQERFESSPIALFSLRHLQTQESMDLDDIGPKTATPKKRREKQSATGASVISEEYTPAQVYPQAPTFTAGRDDENEDQDAPYTPLPPKPSCDTPTIPPSAASILKPRSTNPILPRTSAKTYSAKRHRISDKGADLFSEDGENHLRDADSEEAMAETPSKVVPRAVAGRLAGLLEKPSPRRWQVMNMDDEPDSASESNTADQPTKAPTVKSIIAPRQAVHDRLAAQRVEARKSMNKPKQRDYESDNDMPDLEELAKAKQMKRIAGDKSPETPLPAPKINATARSINARNKVREDVPSTARREEEPLATRPASRLSLDDFRINPDYNNGLDYAYRDVVRGREKRKCLAGCTDPSCCGKGFRALAEIATPIRDNLAPAQREEEDKLLTEFLGRDAARLIKHMGKEERRETLIKAKTRELANKHGKHRHAYERRKSPPGFWRADFPTTQEEAEDREKAKVFERDLVQKRYEEAMRGGGKWIFKDQIGGKPDWIGKE